MNIAAKCHPMEMQAQKHCGVLSSDLFARPGTIKILALSKSQNAHGLSTERQSQKHNYRHERHLTIDEYEKKKFIELRS